jgi:hypothetical protein
MFAANRNNRADAIHDTQRRNAKQEERDEESRAPYGSESRSPPACAVFRAVRQSLRHFGSTTLVRVDRQSGNALFFRGKRAMLQPVQERPSPAHCESSFCVLTKGAAAAWSWDERASK